MKVVRCPDVYERADGDRSVFLGGGISNCPDWQTFVVECLKPDNDSLILINPRRDNFDTTDPNSSNFQIEWEHEHLLKSDAVLFWFPCETLCPITLFELGKMTSSPHHPRLFVGCHVDYARRFDVIKQLSLIAPGVTVHSNLFEVINEVRCWNAAWNLVTS